METFKCPVCGKTGIPDYLNENVVCPNCNSDLGIYKTLNTIAKGNNESGGQVRKYKNLAMVLSALTVLLLGVLAFVYFNKDNNPQIIETSDAKVKELRDSISTLYAQIESQKTKMSNNKSQFIEYTVLSNDSPWGIVRKFYGNRVDWETISRQIAEANDIWDENTKSWKQIHPGQRIKIYSINNE